MAGERSNSTSANNESRASVIATEVGKSKKHQENASSAVCGVRGDQQQQPLLHSRVGGISECDPLGSKNLALRQQEISQGEENDTCRYAVNQSNNNMSFMEVCQIRLQQLFPQIIQNQDRFHLCEEKIELTAECLANDVIRYLLKGDLYLISTDPVSRSMRHNVYQMLNKHSILFTSMVNRLNVVPDTAYEAFMGVADELFDQGITWARIVCLYAFMGRLALWARDRRMYSLKEKLPMYVSRYINEEIAQFIKIYGGWEQLCIEYPVAEELSGAVWRSLLMTGATLGLVATILTITS